MNLRNIYTSNRFLVGSVISYDHKSAGIIVRMNPKAKMGKTVSSNNIYLKTLEYLFNRSFGQTKIERYYFCDRVEEVVNKYKNDLNIHIAGIPVYEAKIQTIYGTGRVRVINPCASSDDICDFHEFQDKARWVSPRASSTFSCNTS